MFSKKKSQSEQPKGYVDTDENTDRDGTFKVVSDTDEDVYGLVKIIGGVCNVSCKTGKPHDIDVDIMYTAEIAEDFTDEQIQRLSDVIYYTGLRESVAKLVREVVSIAAENYRKKSENDHLGDETK